MNEATTVAETEHTQEEDMPSTHTTETEYEVNNEDDESKMNSHK